MNYAALSDRLGTSVDEEDLPLFQRLHQDLLGRRENSCKAPLGDNWGEPKRLRLSSLALRQVMLHRLIGTFEGAVTALLAEQVYSMTLCIRGHYETTGALGYMCGRLDSLRAGTLTAEVVDRDIAVLLLGMKDRRMPEVPSAKQVLSMLELADRLVSKQLLGGTAKQHDLLMDCYSFLCEFCHPNFHSNSAALEVDKRTEQFTFRFEKPLRDEEVALMGYLLLCTPIAIELFDRVPRYLPTAS